MLGKTRFAAAPMHNEISPAENITDRRLDGPSRDIDLMSATNTRAALSKDGRAGICERQRYFAGGRLWA